MPDHPTSPRSAGDDDVLFQPVKIGDTQLPNRVALSPMTRVSAHDNGDASDRMRRYYRRFARGGFGLLITEGVYTDTEHSQGYLNQPGLATTAHAASWRPVVEAVHEAGVAIFAQLMHAGAQSQGNTYRSGTVGPSRVPPRGALLANLPPGRVSFDWTLRGSGPYPAPKALSIAEMRTIRRSFASAARHALAAGFDGVELHGANGYLLDEFLTDYTNQRDDGYGGDTAGRVRFVAEVCDEVMQEVGAELTVGIRLSQTKVSDYEHRWSGGADDARLIFSTIAGTGVHYLHITEYRAIRPAFPNEPATLVALAAEHGGVPVIANGHLEDPATARAMLSGGADVVALGKAALAHRDWPDRVRRGQPVDNELPGDLLTPVAGLKDWELDS